MVRVLLEPALFFLSPFIAYALYLIIRRRYPFTLDHWGGSSVAMLTLCGLVIAILGVLALGLFAERHQGAYVPAHLEKGRLVPGHME